MKYTGLKMHNKTLEAFRGKNLILNMALISSFLSTILCDPKSSSNFRTERKPNFFLSSQAYSFWKDIGGE
jgi:hypothetical protein